MAASDFAGVSAVLQTYFDGLYHSDTVRLAQVFHPLARYCTASAGELLVWDMEHYFAVVDQRPPPASTGQVRTDRILSIAFAGPVTAFACVQCSIAPRHFTDFLTLVQADGRWQIVSKVFHFEV